VVDGRTVHVGNLGLDREVADWTASVVSRASLDGAVIAWVRIDGELAGAILLRDPLRADAPRTLRRLRAAGINRVVMLTGDRPAPAHQIGIVLGLEEVAAQQTPADKVSRLAKVYGYDPRIGKVVEAVGGPAASNVQDFTKPPAMESGGGGLVSTTTDYARFAQMVANGGDLDGVRIVSPATIELMGTNHLPDAALVNSNGSAGTRFNKSTGFGLDFMVVEDPRKAGTLEGKGTMSWGGAAGTWFWVDPTNDVVFVGMIQRFGGSGGDDLGGLSRTLTYQALVNPKK
jgi:CubicO group peptidase (beta-lactamase class C family)